MATTWGHLRGQVCFQVSGGSSELAGYHQPVRSLCCYLSIKSRLGGRRPRSSTSLSLTVKNKLQPQVETSHGSLGLENNSGVKLPQLRATERGQEEQKLAGDKTAGGDMAVRTNQPAEEQQANSPGARR